MRSQRGLLGLGELERRQHLCEVACARMVETAVLERRLDLGANLLRLPATRPEATARRRVDGARHIALEDDALTLAPAAGGSR